MNADAIPLWAFFFGTIAIILFSVEAGFRVGRVAARRTRHEKESPAAAMGGAVLGLVAFMLAFTFSIASGRFDHRKELVRNDADAIRTAWLRSDFLGEPERSEVRALLREYLDIRIAAVETKDLAKVRECLAASADIQKRLWDRVVANGKKDLNSDIGALLVEAVNEIFNSHASRVTVGVDTRIPMGIWGALYVLAVLGMIATGFHAALTGPRRPWMSAILALSFALVITLIAGLDRPETPFVTVSQKPLRNVRAIMDQAPDLAPGRAPSPN